MEHVRRRLHAPKLQIDGDATAVVEDENDQPIPYELNFQDDADQIDKADGMVEMEEDILAFLVALVSSPTTQSVILWSTDLSIHAPAAVHGRPPQ